MRRLGSGPDAGFWISFALAMVVNLVVIGVGIWATVALVEWVTAR